MKRKLEMDVSVSEMLSMRALGMSNSEIAECLGVTYQTILRYIGKQTGIRKPARKRQETTIKYAESPCVSVETSKEPMLMTEQSVYTIHGKTAVFHFNPKIRSICIEHSGIHSDCLGQFIDELKELQTIINFVSKE